MGHDCALEPVREPELLISMSHYPKRAAVLAMHAKFDLRIQSPLLPTVLKDQIATVVPQREPATVLFPGGAPLVWPGGLRPPGGNYACLGVEIDEASRGPVVSQAHMSPLFGATGTTNHDSPKL